MLTILIPRLRADGPVCRVDIGKYQKVWHITDVEPWKSW